MRFLLATVVLVSGTLLLAADEPASAVKKKVLVAIKQKRPQPPTREYDGPGAPPFTMIKAAGLDAEALLKLEGNFVAEPPYEAVAERRKMPSVPAGTLRQFSIDSKDGTIYNPGIAREVFGAVDPSNPKTLIVDTHTIDYARTITVYVPAQYVSGTEAPFMVTHDGPKKVGKPKPKQELAIICDNLIAQKRIPPMVVISIANGGGDAQGSQRGKEYDTMSAILANYVESHVLPLVERNYKVKLSKDPDARAVMGNSSGGSAAFTMAWYRPDLYRRVITFSGTYVNQQWPFNPETPDGAWGYHTTIIPNSEVKPLRIWLGVGDRDNFNPNIMRDGMHDWVAANHRMAKALKAKGYTYQYLFAVDNGHGMRPAKQQYLAHAIEWAWQDYKPKK